MKNKITTSPGLEWARKEGTKGVRFIIDHGPRGLKKREGKMKDLLLECVEIDVDDGGFWASFKSVDHEGPSINTYFADDEDPPPVDIKVGTRLVMAFYRKESSVKHFGEWDIPNDVEYEKDAPIHVRGDWGYDAHYYLNQYGDQRPDPMRHGPNYRQCLEKGEELLLKIINKDDLKTDFYEIKK